MKTTKLFAIIVAFSQGTFSLFVETTDSRFFEIMVN